MRELTAKQREVLAFIRTLVAEPPRDPAGWGYEMKFDGYRILARCMPKAVDLFSRNGRDWTARLPGVQSALASLGTGQRAP